MKDKIKKALVLILVLICTFEVGLLIDSKLKKISFDDKTKVTSNVENCAHKGDYNLSLDATYGKDFDIEKDLDIEKFAIKLNINENGVGQIKVLGDRGLGNKDILKAFIKQKDSGNFEVTSLETDMTFKFSEKFYQKTGFNSLLKGFSVSKETKDDKEYFVLKGQDNSFYFEKVQDRN